MIKELEMENVFVSPDTVMEFPLKSIEVEGVSIGQIMYDKDADLIVSINNFFSSWGHNVANVTVIHALGKSGYVHGTTTSNAYISNLVPIIKMPTLEDILARTSHEIMTEEIEEQTFGFYTGEPVLYENYIVGEIFAFHGESDGVYAEVEITYLLKDSIYGVGSMIYVPLTLLASLSSKF